MLEITDDELGPIDFLVVEFPAGTNRFTGELARELASLVDAEIVRVLDLMILHKHDDGSFEVTEFEDLDAVGDLGMLEGEMAEVLTAEDVANVASVMTPGTTAGVLVWEHRWAAPFAVAARRMGAQLIVNDRIHTQAMIASLQAAATEQGT